MKIECPGCKKEVGTKQWAPGYPGLRKHKGKDGKPCPVSYVRESKVDGRWVQS